MANAKDRARERWHASRALKLFDDFDEKDFHPTLEFRCIKDETGYVVGMMQQYRHKVTDEPEWREVTNINLPAEHA